MENKLSFSDERKYMLSPLKVWENVLHLEIVFKSLQEISKSSHVVENLLFHTQYNTFCKPF